MQSSLLNMLRVNGKMFRAVGNRIIFHTLHFKGKIIILTLRCSFLSILFGPKQLWIILYIYIMAKFGIALSSCLFTIRVFTQCSMYALMLEALHIHSHIVITFRCIFLSKEDEKKDWLPLPVNSFIFYGGHQ